MATLTRANADGSNSNGFRIPPYVLGIVLALIVNVTRKQWQQWHGQDTTLASSAQEEEDLLTLAELHAIANTINAPTHYSQEDTLTQATSGAGTQVHSNFIRDPNILSTLNNVQLWEDCMNHQDTFRWLDRGATPTNLWEELVVQIWKDHPLIVNQKLAGYEYWCNIIKPQAPLNWHVDKDEVEHAREDKLVTPYMGAVWYGYPHEFTGEGHLELFPFHPYTVPDPTGVRDLQDRVERISPHYNRLIFLNVSQWHRVAPIQTGARNTLAVNVWMHKPKAAMVAEEEAKRKKEQPSSS